MSPSPAPSSPALQPTSQPEELVQVDTALAVLAKVNLLAESNALALDIGGSLAKLIYLQPDRARAPAPIPLLIHRVDGNVASALSVHVPELRGTLHFFAFETCNIHQLLRFIRDHWANDRIPAPETHRLIRATGGGSYKYAATFEAEIGVTLARLDEMACTVAGLNFLLTTVKEEVYEYLPPTPLPTPPGPEPAPAPEFTRRFVDTTRHPFPYLLVNIGSGVSIVKVTAHDKSERVSGSSLGGGTFWGLARMLLHCATFDDVIRLTHDGDNANIDMLVGDIYGGGYSSLGLDASVIAASFGKATMRNDPALPQPSSLVAMKDRFIRACTGSFDLWMSFFDSIPVLGRVMRALIPTRNPFAPVAATDLSTQFRQQDIALSLLRMVSYNIGQIAYLNARVHNLDRIYFGGNFIRNHPYTTADISFAVDFWSEGKMKALFLRHDGYLGAIGAFIGASSGAPTKIFEQQKNARLKKNASTGVKAVRGVKAARVQNSRGVLQTANQESTHLDDDILLTKPALGEADRAVKPVNGKPHKPGGTQKRKKNKRSSSDVPASSSTQPSIDANAMSPEWQLSDFQEFAIGEPKASGDGDWTTVSRVRRRGTNQNETS